MLKTVYKRASEAFKNYFKKNRRKKIWTAAAVFVLAVLFIYSCSQQNESPLQYEAQDAVPQYSGLDLMLKVFLSLVIISALIYITVYVLRFFYRKKNNASSTVGKQGSFMQVADCINLDGKNKIFLLKAADSMFLIGSSENQVNLISRIRVSDYTQYMKSSKDNGPVEIQEKKFKTIFSSYFRNMGI